MESQYQALIFVITSLLTFLLGYKCKSKCWGVEIEVTRMRDLHNNNNNSEDDTLANTSSSSSEDVQRRRRRQNRPKSPGKRSRIASFRNGSDHQKNPIIAVHLKRSMFSSSFDYIDFFFLGFILSGIGVPYILQYMKSSSQNSPKYLVLFL